MTDFSIDRTKQADAAHRLEELNIASSEIVRLLRAGQGNRFAYALVYELRKQLGYVVRELGEGVPNKEMQDRATEAIDAQIWEGTPRG